MNIICFLSCYLLAMLFEGLRVWKKAAAFRWIALASAGLGACVHVAYLLVRHNQTGLPPLVASTHDWLLVLALVTVVAYLVIQFRNKTVSFGLFMLPLVVLLTGASAYVGREATTLDETMRVWIIVHTASLVLGFGSVLMGFVLSLMYLLQHNKIKKKQFSEKGIHLPNLERLASRNRWTVISSTILLTIGMVSGVGLAWLSKKEKPSLNWSEPIVIGYVVLWFLMIALFVWLLKSKRSQNRQVAFLLAWAFGFMLVTLIGLMVLTGNTATITTWHG